MKTRAILRNHAKRRAAERFGVTLTSKQIDQIVTMIHSNEAQFIKRRSLNRTMFRVLLDGEPCQVVYDKKHKTLVTFLYENQNHQKGMQNDNPKQSE